MVDGFHGFHQTHCDLAGVEGVIDESLHRLGGVHHELGRSWPHQAPCSSSVMLLMMDRARSRWAWMWAFNLAEAGHQLVDGLFQQELDPLQFTQADIAHGFGGTGMVGHQGCHFVAQAREGGAGGILRRVDLLDSAFATRPGLNHGDHQNGRPPP
jgi:hypothetical protein